MDGSANSPYTDRGFAFDDKEAEAVAGRTPGILGLGQGRRSVSPEARTSASPGTGFCIGAGPVRSDPLPIGFRAPEKGGLVLGDRRSPGKSPAKGGMPTAVAVQAKQMPQENRARKPSWAGTQCRMNAGLRQQGESERHSWRWSWRLHADKRGYRPTGQPSTISTGKPKRPLGGRIYCPGGDDKAALVEVELDSGVHIDDFDIHDDEDDTMSAFKKGGMDSTNRVECMRASRLRFSPASKAICAVRPPVSHPFLMAPAAP
eukprot:gene22603-30873_t